MTSKFVNAEIVCAPTKEQRKILEDVRKASELLWNISLEFFRNRKEPLSVEIRDEFISTIINMVESESIDEKYRPLTMLSNNTIGYIIGRVVNEANKNGINNLDEFGENTKRLSFIHFSGIGICKMDPFHIYIPGLGSIFTINRGNTHVEFWKVVNNLYDEDFDDGEYEIDKANFFFFKTNHKLGKLVLYCTSIN